MAVCVCVCVQVNVRKVGPHSPVLTVLKRLATRIAARVGCVETLMSSYPVLTDSVCVCVCVCVYVLMHVCVQTHACAFTLCSGQEAAAEYT